MILENLKIFIDSRGISIAAFEKSIGMSNNSFRKSLNTGGNLGSDKLENILRIYPDLNPTWILTGHGDMLNTSNRSDENANLNANPNANLSTKSGCESENKDINLSQKGRMIEEAASKEMPLCRQYNIGGYEPIPSTKEVAPSNQLNELIRDLIEQLNGKSEEIGALKQENASLKYRLAQYAEDAPDAQGARA